MFELEDGTEKSFMRSVQGSSSEHRINNNVCLHVFKLYYNYKFEENLSIFFLYRLLLAKFILMNWNNLVLMLKQKIFWYFKELLNQ